MCRHVPVKLKVYDTLPDMKAKPLPVTAMLPPLAPAPCLSSRDANSLQMQPTYTPVLLSWKELIDLHVHRHKQSMLSFVMSACESRTKLTQEAEGKGMLLLCTHVPASACHSGERLHEQDTGLGLQQCGLRRAESEHSWVEEQGRGDVGTEL